MERTVLHPLKDFPEHAAIIGRLLFKYADLEVDILGMVADALGGDFHAAIRVLYRLRSESNRLEVADALVRPLCQRHNLIGTYVQWLGAMRRCKAIRNQYAHCIWDYQKRKIPVFSDLDETAKLPEGDTVLHFKPLTLDLLKEQEAFFCYVDDLIYHLRFEIIFAMDRRRTRHRTRRPKALPLPPLDSRPDPRKRPAPA